MMAGVREAGETGIHVGTVLRDTVAVFARNAVAFTAVGLLSSLPTLALDAMTGVDTGRTVALVADIVLGLMIACVCQAMIVDAACESMARRPVRMARSVARGVKRALPVLGVSFLSVLFIVLGLLVLIVPGVIVALIVSVAIPACVIEDLGPFDSLRRSDELTSGFRWRIFGVLALFTIATWIGNTLVQALYGVVAPWAGLVLEALWTGVDVAVNAIVAAVLYVALRAAKRSDATEPSATG